MFIKHMLIQTHTVPFDKTLFQRALLLSQHTHTHTVRLSVGVKSGDLCAMSHLLPPPPLNSSLAPAKKGIRENMRCA